jgi:hypothetical protein
MTHYTRISACGLNCTTCDLLLLPASTEAQNRLFPWFRGEKWLGENEGIKEVIERRIYCRGCAVDKEIFWGSKCELALCCKNTRHLSNCSECEVFPCEKYNKWLDTAPLEQGDEYKKAYEYLLQFKASG